jgi:phosphatidylglycerol lysyltransferase
LKNAWRLALLLSFISLIGNITKALDYEEASFAAIIILLLLLSRSQYTIRSNIKWIRMGLFTVIIVFSSVLVFGFVSFYFIDARHIGIDFSWKQSLLYSFRFFIIGGANTLQPLTPFGHQFIWIIHSLGFLSWGFLFFTIIVPYLKIETGNESDRQKAQSLLSQYGNSSIDYFKITKDKLLLFSGFHDAFISYRVANGFAIVLGEPVCAEEYKAEVLREFYDRFKKMGLRIAFYRVDENDIMWFDHLRKQKLVIGQEAILSVENFKMEGKDKRSLRNALNSLEKKGLTTSVQRAPLPQNLLMQLKQVSTEWLTSFDKE